MEMRTIIGVRLDSADPQILAETSDANVFLLGELDHLVSVATGSKRVDEGKDGESDLQTYDDPPFINEFCIRKVEKTIRLLLSKGQTRGVPASEPTSCTAYLSIRL